MSGTQQGWHLFLGEWEKIKSRSSWWGRMDGTVEKVGGRETWTSAKAVPVTLLATLQFLLKSFFSRGHRYQWETQHGLVHSLLGIVMKTKSRLFKCFVSFFPIVVFAVVFLVCLVWFILYFGGIGYYFFCFSPLFQFLCSHDINMH